MTTALAPAPAAGRRALLSREEAAELLGVKPQTLAKWVSDGNYDLPVVKVGRLSKYRPADVEAFIDRNTVSANSL
ncbi:MAG: helix-turn-helix domain-containing protein [Pirellulaceae bacterium]|nr:helix-turn-helix domain-containing protein [Pirellulaceae bacterium]